MHRTLDVPAIAALFAAKGGFAYEGEAVTHLEHALQTASLAEAESAPPTLVAAAFLHDIGHLLSDLTGTPTERGLDDRHERRALRGLRGLLGDEVLGPIAGHVDAKRFLCAMEPGYEAALSPDSRRSLVLQGGVMGRAEQHVFLGGPHAREAVRLRRWDDRAKVVGLRTPPLDHFLVVVRACVLG
jgi:phosphonate degradation associated HDIG domain protein